MHIHNLLQQGSRRFPLNSPPLIVLRVFVQNQSGEDLLNPATKGNVLESCNIFHYNKKYPLNKEDIKRFTDTRRFYLRLTFFPDENNYQTFVLMWGDGSRDIISCDKLGNEIFLNGEEVFDDTPYRRITIIR